MLSFVVICLHGLRLVYSFTCCHNSRQEHKSKVTTRRLQITDSPPEPVNMGVSTILKDSIGLQTCLSMPLVHKRQMPAHRLPVSKRRRRLAVRFDLESIQVQETERVSQDSKASVWYSRMERDGIQEANKRQARLFLQQQPLVAGKANIVFDRFCQDHLVAVSDDSSSEEEEYENVRICDENDEPDHDEIEIQDKLAAAGSCTLDIPGHVRGLEGGFLPAAKRYRRTHVQQVLKWQQCLGKDQPHLLSSRAIRSSRPSRVLARILGVNDQANAKDEASSHLDGHAVVRRHRCRMLPTWW